MQLFKKEDDERILMLIEISLNSIELNVEFFAEDARFTDLLRREQNVKTEILRLKGTVILFLGLEISSII